MLKKSTLFVLVMVGSFSLTIPALVMFLPVGPTTTGSTTGGATTTDQLGVPKVTSPLLAHAAPTKEPFQMVPPPLSPSPSPTAPETKPLAKEAHAPHKTTSVPAEPSAKPGVDKERLRTYREARMRYYGWHTLSDSVSINQFASSPAAWGHPNPQALALTFPRVLDEETEVSEDTAALFVSDWHKEPAVRAGLRFSFTPTCYGKTAASFVGTYWLARNARSSAENVANQPAFDAAIDDVAVPGATASTSLGYNLRFALENGIGTLLADSSTGEYLYTDSSLQELADRLGIHVTFPLPVAPDQLKTERDKFKAAYAVFAVTQDMRRATLVQASEADRAALEAATVALKSPS